MRHAQRPSRRPRRGRLRPSTRFRCISWGETCRCDGTPSRFASSTSDAAVAVHAPVREGMFAPRPGGPAAPSSTQRALHRRSCSRSAPASDPSCDAWAEAAYAERADPRPAAHPGRRSRSLRQHPQGGRPRGRQDRRSIASSAIATCNGSSIAKGPSHSAVSPKSTTAIRPMTDYRIGGLR